MNKPKKEKAKKRKEKIGVFLDTKFPPNYEKFLDNLYRMNLDYEFYLIGSVKTNAKIINKFNIKYLLKNSNNAIKSIIQLIKFIKKENPAMIFNITDIFSGLILSVICKLYGTEMIFRIGGETLGSYKHYSGVGKIKALVVRDLIFRIPVYLSKHVALASEYQEKQHRQFLQKKHTVLLKNPTCREFFKSQITNEKERIKKQLQLPLNKKIILFIGRFSKEKGFDIIKKLMRDLNKDSNFFLLIGGQYKKANNLTAIKYVKYDQIKKYYQAADLLVHPSVTEVGGNVSNTVLEALAAEIPVIVRERKGTHVISNTFRTYNQLKKMIQEGTYKLDKFPKQYDLATVRKEYAAVFRKILEYSLLFQV
jgi:glycosyltransferase involved in cell wall biosynthesis